ncbi:hypothetical protein [Streptomyces sp. NPDC006879]|uniref:hypothetical protein n=1 Tax=Streptomyces sp. NPDC006879 TaxID=3364767 RepID=UPI0036A3B67E
MALFGLFGNDRQMATTTYSAKESASDKAARKEADRSAKRRNNHHRTGATKADRAGQRWADAERERQEGRPRRRGWFG